MTDWMALAIEQARLAEAAGEVPVGAVMVRNDQLLCAAHNLREATHDPTAHAEILCLRKAASLLGRWQLNDCTLYVTLEPCPMCAGAMVMSRLGCCVFAAADDRLGCCGSVYDLPADPALGGVTRWQAGDHAEECRAMLQSFFRSRRGADKQAR